MYKIEYETDRCGLTSSSRNGPGKKRIIGLYARIDVTQESSIALQHFTAWCLSLCKSSAVAVEILYVCPSDGCIVTNERNKLTCHKRHRFLGMLRRRPPFVARQARFTVCRRSSTSTCNIHSLMKTIVPLKADQNDWVSTEQKNAVCRRRRPRGRSS